MPVSLKYTPGPTSGGKPADMCGISDGQPIARPTALFYPAISAVPVREGESANPAVMLLHPAPYNAAMTEMRRRRAKINGDGVGGSLPPISYRGV